MCICVILLESLSRSFCCAVSNVAARILDAAMAIPTVMAHLVSLLHRIVARLIAHRYIQHQCAYVLFYSNRFSGCAVFNVAARILVSAMVMPTAMAQVIAQRYV